MRSNNCGEFDALGTSSISLRALFLMGTIRPDNDTRWNSVDTMMERAMQLRNVVDLFCQRNLRERDRIGPRSEALDTCSPDKHLSEAVVLLIYKHLVNIGK